MSSTDPSSEAQLSPPIFLLKTPSSPRDMYEEYFRNNTFPIRRQQQQQQQPESTSEVANTDNVIGKHTKYDPLFVPVLSHRFHQDNLRMLVSYFGPIATEQQLPVGGNAFNGTGKRYGGLIFTSQRAVEAFGQAVEIVGQSGIITQATSRELILYTVGPATTRTLTPFRDKYLPHATIYGEEAGTGENLAHMMLKHYNERYNHHIVDETTGPKPGLLFLVGEQRRDIIPKTLMSQDLDEKQRIKVDEMVVYETTEMEGFETAYRDVVAKGNETLELMTRNQQASGQDGDGCAGQHMWTVVFSPQGCEAVLRTLNIPRKQPGEEKDEQQDKDERSRRNCLIATIGPTTRDYLIKNYGFEPDVVARKPSPEGVGEAIKEYYLARAS